MKSNKLLRPVLTNWNLMRWLRLLIGLFIGFEAARTGDKISWLFAVFFLAQAIFGFGCCGAGSCAVPLRRNDNDKG
jgi:hypothetical protein